MTFLSQLNPSQRRAAEHFSGPLLVVAGAGSGKTRTLIYRLANLILTHQIDPENILAVTFTNKAAREMRERMEKILAQEYTKNHQAQNWDDLAESKQTELKSHIYRTWIKPLWIGTFHSLCGKILRYDIDKYQDEKGRTWNKNFTIFDESDTLSLIKKIIAGMNLDDKKFEHRTIRYVISNAKNLGLNPTQFADSQPNQRGRIIGDIYQMYQLALAENNALDFDDLILIPVRLFQQNQTVLNYWHNKFTHILVDEYQDTNRTQYDLIRLLVTGGIDPQLFDNWSKRSILVVGDADQSIYSFRMADFTILMDFQKDFGDGLTDDLTQTMIKLEENYRSKDAILIAANSLIENNTQRIPKVLKPTRGSGEPIVIYGAPDEIGEANFVINKILTIREYNPEYNWGSFAILYRTNAQSRALEDALRGRVPYQMVGGFRFYERKEIKDVLAYLHVINNPDNTQHLLRVINVPKRGVGDKTIESLVEVASNLGVPLWSIVSDETSVNTIAGRSAKKIKEFVDLIQTSQSKLDQLTAVEIATIVMEDSGYLDELKKIGTDESRDRLQNINELFNAIQEFQERQGDTTLSAFLANASLASDLDNLTDSEQAVSLMTLHSAKGLEFEVVFLVGLEEGLLPHARSINDPKALEEERRLCYVGITRAQERLFLTYAKLRRLYGSREDSMISRFMNELPKEVFGTTQHKVHKLSKPVLVGSKSATLNWEIGDRVYHGNFGEGEVWKVFSSPNKMTLAIKFETGSIKIIDPKTAPIRRI